MRQVLKEQGVDELSVLDASDMQRRNYCCNTHSQPLQMLMFRIQGCVIIQAESRIHMADPYVPHRHSQQTAAAGVPMKSELVV